MYLFGIASNVTHPEIPRKLSADDHHPLVGQMRVYLDGDEMRHVTDYDMDAGTVTHLVHADDGKPMHRNGAWVTRTRTGRVTVGVRV